MAANSDAEETKDSKDSVDPLIDQLIKDILSKAEPESKAVSREEDVTAALTGAAMASLSRTVGGASVVERLLLGELLANSIAEALAPAIAKAIAPEIMALLKEVASPKASSQEPAPSGAGKKAPSGRSR